MEFKYALPKFDLDDLNWATKALINKSIQNKDLKTTITRLRCARYWFDSDHTHNQISDNLPVLIQIASHRPHAGRTQWFLLHDDSIWASSVGEVTLEGSAWSWLASLGFSHVVTDQMVLWAATQVLRTEWPNSENETQVWQENRVSHSNQWFI